MSSCIFHDTGAERRDPCLFGIVESALSRRERVLIYADGEARAADIDRMLWVLKQESFLPHRVMREEDRDAEIPVAIVTVEINPAQAGILIADGHCGLDFAVRFRVIHEFVTRTSPGVHQACRERYRAYRSRQVAVEHLREG
ncbi:MAG: DNA polymerase III subunit chi [Acidobacteria bacterium]|nr:DNA polymerase III subunit chi [Acidobacteriota bacterium]